MKKICLQTLLLLSYPVSLGAEAPTYENFGERFFTQYCTSCHHSTRPEEDRHQAPIDANFDNLQLIREWIFEIRDIATGENPEMPPADGVWPWDRDRLAEWIDAGMPGEGIENLPAQEGLDDPARNSFWYERMNMAVTRPSELADNERRLHIVGLAKFTGKQNVLEEEIVLRREGDGSTLMVSHKKRRDGSRANPFVTSEFDPPIPILPVDMQPGAQWTGTVQVTPRLSNGSTGVPFQVEYTVFYDGFEHIDNGVGAPEEAFCVRVHSFNPLERNPENEDVWFFQIGKGLVRFVRQVNPLLLSEVEDLDEGRDYGYLAGSPEIEDETTTFFPFENGMLVYNFEHQRKVSLLGQEEETPDPTATLGPDFTRTPSNTPTITPTSSVTPTPSHTAVPTDTPVILPTATETPVPPTPIANDPDLNDVLVVDAIDLILFLDSWDEPIETMGKPSGPLPVGDPRRSDINGDNSITSMDLMSIALKWRESMAQ